MGPILLALSIEMEVWMMEVEVLVLLLVAESRIQVLILFQTQELTQDLLLAEVVPMEHMFTTL